MPADRADYLRRYRKRPAARALRREAMVRYLDRVKGADRPRRTLGPLPVEHGTYAAYVKRGCRCEACRAASAAYHRDRRTQQSRAA